MPSNLTYPTEKVTLDNPAEIDWPQIFSSKGKGILVPVKCPACRQWHNVRASACLKQDFRGLHARCYNEIRKASKTEGLVRKIGGKRIYTGDMLLPKGSKVRFDVRRNDDSKQVAFECRGCFNETGQLKYTELSALVKYIKGQVNWRELCEECCRAVGSPWRHTEDKKSKKSETITLFSQEKDGMIPVLAETCRCIWWTTRENAINNWTFTLIFAPTTSVTRASLSPC